MFKDKKMRKLFIIPITGLMLFAGFLNSSIAGYHYHGCNYMGDMSAMDSNQDGLITSYEFSAHHMEKYKRGFDIVDTYNDDMINEEEMNELLKVNGYDKNLESKWVDFYVQSVLHGWVLPIRVSLFINILTLCAMPIPTTLPFLDYPHRPQNRVVSLISGHQLQAYF
jgi:hypothetical protein